MTRDDYISIRKAEAWAEAKGALGKLWELDGQRYSTRGAGEPVRFEKVKEAVDAFIEGFEAEGLHE